jgi:hypothetical protein
MPSSDAELGGELDLSLFVSKSDGCVWINLADNSADGVECIKAIVVSEVDAVPVATQVGVDVAVVVWRHCDVDVDVEDSMEISRKGRQSDDA